MLNHLIRKSKCNHYHSYFENFKHNSKKIWKGINELINRSKCKNTDKIQLRINNNIINDDNMIANHFNRYFTSIASNLVDKLGTTTSNYSNYLKNPNSKSFFVTPVVSNEVQSVINNLDENKSADSYDLPPKLIKLSSESILTPLTHLINASFSSGYYPKLLKYAKVIPIYMGKSPCEVSNYRPISLLPYLNRICEKLMYKRLISFIDENKIIYEHQFGFQKGKSTSQAILDMSTKIVTAIENKELSCCVFLDFAKAFDTVDHHILIKKLDYYGIRGTAQDWFKSYLSNRTQRVSINGVLSKDLQIKYGVPQGSVLGPLLFLLYINDIRFSSKVLNFHIFVDDTSIFFADNNINNLENTINKELENVSDWLMANKLTLNLSKSNFLLIRPSQKKLARKIELM